MQGPRTRPERRAIDHLTTLIRQFDKNQRFTTAVTGMEEGWQAFCELRDILQLSNAELPRANLGRDLEDQPAQAALAANLRHPDYVRVLCGSLDHLPVAFAELDQQASEGFTSTSLYPNIWRHTL